MFDLKNNVLLNVSSFEFNHFKTMYSCNLFNCKKLHSETLNLHCRAIENVYTLQQLLRLRQVIYNCMASVGCFVLGIVTCLKICQTHGMNKHVSHFEYLTYDIHDLRQQHERSRRSVSTYDTSPPVELQFQSHGRFFDIRLVPDDTIFHPDLVIEGPRGELIDRSLAHVYHGSLYGKPGSYVHGSIIDGIFRGVVEDRRRGKYYMEENTNFFGGSRGQSPLSGYRGHSVMYHEDAVKFPKTHSSLDQCGSSNKGVMDKMLKFENSSVFQRQRKSTSRSRKKRALNSEKTTCLLYVQNDYILYEEYPSSEVIISKVAEHVKAANRIYTTTEFVTLDGVPIRNINFKVQRMKINDSETEKDLANPYRSRNLGVEKFLDIASLENHDLYCLAYVFTNRDFDNGVLGLAWVASPGGSSGGICEKYKTYSDKSSKSLNTGVVTFKNFGSVMPAKVSHLTFAHELGHNFGSPHDSGSLCTPGEGGGFFNTEGNYIMFARATTGNEPNNKYFSPCSIGNISAVLEAKKDNCFVSSNQPICGNQIVDEGEVCDCGYEDTCQTQFKDTCCTPADSKYGDMRCQLKAGASCSVTQGPCCNSDCTRKSDTFVCSPETECQYAQTCNSSTPTAVCPEARHAEEAAKVCFNGTQTCMNGECIGSICRRYSALEECECTIPEESKNRAPLCHTCCQLKGNRSTCKSSGLFPEFNNVTLFLRPGSACDDYNGYCDIFSNCRLVDADGPLSRLKKAIFSSELYGNIVDWITEFWWAVALMGVGFVVLMVAFIKVCSVHTPSSNPEMPKAKLLPGAEAIRRHSIRRQSMRRQSQALGVMQNRMPYQMGR